MIHDSKFSRCFDMYPEKYELKRIGIAGIMRFALENVSRRMSAIQKLCFWWVCLHGLKTSSGTEPIIDVEEDASWQ